MGAAQAAASGAGPEPRGGRGGGRLGQSSVGSGAGEAKLGNAREGTSGEPFHLPAAELDASPAISLSPRDAPRGGYRHHSCLTDEETEAQTG